MNDNDIKNLFAKLAIPAAGVGFEERIIATATRPARVFSGFRGLAAAAAVVLVIFSASILPATTQPSPQEKQYASLIDNSVVDDDDVYDDLIISYNNAESSYN